MVEKGEVTPALCSSHRQLTGGGASPSNVGGRTGKTKQDERKKEGGFMMFGEGGKRFDRTT